MVKNDYVYYGIDIALFVVLLFVLDDFIIALVVSTIFGVLLGLLDPISKLQKWYIAY